MVAVATQVELSGSARPRVPGAELLGPLPADQLLSVTVLVRQRPGTDPLPDHRQTGRHNGTHARSIAEFTRRYGAGEDDLQSVVDYLTQAGLTVTERHAGRTRVIAAGTAAAIGAAFGVQLNNYRAPVPAQALRSSARAEDTTRIHRGFEGALRVPAELAELVTAVLGLDNRNLGAPTGTGDPTAANSLLPTQVAALYHFPDTGAAGQTIGLFADASGKAAFRPSDITAFINGLPAGHRTQPTVNAISLTVGGTTYTNDPTLATITNNYALEITQDISTAAAVAQGVTINVYLTEDTEAGWEAFLNRAIVPDPGDSAPSVLSASWVMTFADDVATVGAANVVGTTANTLSTLLQRAAAAGITVFLPAGDWGSDDTTKDGKCHVPYPNSDPWAISCGGTIIGNVGAGADPTFDEWVWSDANSNSPFGSSTSDFGSTGGGVSDNFPVPSYQSDNGISPISNNDNLSRRGLPDITGMVALTGFVINGGGYGFTGTSCVAPLYAGLAAVVNSLVSGRIGFFDPQLYADPGGMSRDITHGDNDSADTPDATAYSAATGWDPASGWGVLDGNGFLSAMINANVRQSLQFWVGKSTFGVDEVTDSRTWPNAFSLVLEGFAPFQLAGGLPVPALGGAFTNFPGVTITPNPSLARWEDAGQSLVPQRLEIPYDVSFSTASLASFPTPGSGPVELELDGVVGVDGNLFAAGTLIELVAGADPYFTNINPTADNVFWLSQDLRVFTATPGLDHSPVHGAGNAPALNPAGPSTLDAAAGYQYIRDVLTYLNQNYSDPTGVDPFDGVVPQQSAAFTGDSSVSPTLGFPSGAPFVNYNFAIARVRLRGMTGSSANDVKVFFRMFLTQTNDTDYQPSTTYRSTLDAAGRPSTPLPGSADQSIPFFATDDSGTLDYSAGGANNQPVTVTSGDQEWAYFGCFLNVYDINNVVDGLSVPARLMGTHHCLVAQIAYDDAPIVNRGGLTMSPENSDKLAQRNLQVTSSDNPGPAAAHRVPQTFDLRPSRLLAVPGSTEPGVPDELMIDWGRTPVGAAATIYWPAVDAGEVISLADSLYARHSLTAVDAHTILLPVTDGVAYVPIPASPTENIAGLLTIDLPTTVTKGESFTVVVRRVASRHSDDKEQPTEPQPRIADRSLDGPPVDGPPIGGEKRRDWRYVVGTFQIDIPVETASTMLEPDERTLSVFKWRLTQTRTSDRWYPILRRYVKLLSGRIDGLGGDSSSVQPFPFESLTVKPGWGEPGDGDHGGGHRTGHREVGKITGLVYDRFGDFRGFRLENEQGDDRAYASREREIESLARYAWSRRIVVEVCRDHHHRFEPSLITLLQMPRAIDFE